MSLSPLPKNNTGNWHQVLRVVRDTWASLTTSRGALCSFDLDNPHVVSQALRHCLGGLVASALMKANLPPQGFACTDWESPFAARARTNLRHHLHVLAELKQVARNLNQAALPFLVYKGPILTTWYGGSERRQYSDLDLMVRSPEDAHQAKTLLLQLGYRLTHSFTRAQERHHLKSQCEYHLVHPDWGTLVELHWRPFYSYLQLTFDLQAAWRRMITVELAGTAYQTFSPEDSLVLLACHAARHSWSHLQLVFDLAFVLHRFPAIDWDLARAVARQTQADRLFLVGLAIVGEILPDALPHHVRESLRHEPNLHRGVAMSLRHLRAVSTPDLSHWQAARYFARLLDRTTLRWKYLLQGFFTPTEKDFIVNQLPDWAFHLYPVFRLLRHLRYRKVL